MVGHWNCNTSFINKGKLLPQAWATCGAMFRMDRRTQNPMTKWLLPQLSSIVKRPISDGVAQKNGGVDEKGRIGKVCLSHLK